MEMGEDVVIRVVNTLYVIADSGLQWYLKYLNHHQERLGMHFETTNQWFTIIHDENGYLYGIVIIQDDNSLATRSDKLQMDEERVSINLKTKPRAILAKKSKKFNGIRKTRERDQIHLEHGDSI